MGLVADYVITCERLPLVGVAAETAATIELELQYNHGDLPPFIVHVTDGATAGVESAFESAAFVRDYTLIGEAGDTRHYQILPAADENPQLGDRLDLSALRSLATTEAIIDRIRAIPTGWVQTGWFADRAAFDEFRSFWQRNGMFTLRRLSSDREPKEPGAGLTDSQHEALRVAYEMGYFEIPRRTSLDEVAAELGIPPSSLSERLRRAQTHLVETSVASTWPPLPDSSPHD